MRTQRPVGAVTRGTTHANRLRRIDRWLLASYGQVVRRATDPVVVDLGFGARPTTTLELAARLRRVNPSVQVVGLDIDPVRVTQAAALAGPGVSFARGGFEMPVPRPVLLVRAANVLRQYDASQVRPAWERMRAALAPGGIVIDATTDELGRLCSWVTLDEAGPRWLTIAADLRRIDRPGQVAARLPKLLIHDNVPEQPIHGWLAGMDEEWQRHAPMAPFGARYRFAETVRALAGAGWPIRGGPDRWRLGEVTLDWAAVAPRSTDPPNLPGQSGQRA